MQNGTSGLPIPSNQIPEVTYSAKAGSSKQSRKIHRCDICGYESLYSTHMRRHQLVHSRNFWQCHLVSTALLREAPARPAPAGSPWAAQVQPVWNLLRLAKRAQTTQESVTVRTAETGINEYTTDKVTEFEDTDWGDKVTEFEDTDWGDKVTEFEDVYWGAK